MTTSQFRWRKLSPLDRDGPICELLDGHVIILDVTRANDSRLEIAFHEGAAGRILDLAAFEAMIGEVKALLARS
jgi:hypothetical protein